MHRQLLTVWCERSRRQLLSRCLLLLLVIGACSTAMYARIDTIYRDNGIFASANTLTTGWEESVILQPGAPCRIVGISVYYVGTGLDTIRITGDASEGTIPPTVWAYSYNTLWSTLVDVTQTGWKYITFNTPLEVGGFDRVVVQHLVRTGAPQFGCDGGQGAVTSYYYDPVSPNPNFFNIPGIYYAARGDYMVRLHVEYTFPAPVRGSQPMPAPLFADVTRDVGLTNADNTLMRADMASIVDVNNDGYEDVVIGSQVFRNNAGNGFTRLNTGISAGATTWADFDSDGDADCFAMHGFGNDKLYKQNADGSFTDLGNAGIVNNAPGVAPLWLDYDADGALDLFIANGRTEQSGEEVYFPDKLFRNKKDGTFEDVTTASGIAAFEPAPFYDTWGASVCDYNNDGRTDIFVATYRLAPDKLYRNNGNGTFSDVSASTEIQGIPTSVPSYFGHGMGSDWGDLNNDGFVDAAVGNLGHPDSRAQYSNPSMVYAGQGPPSYTFQPRIRKRGGVTFKEMNAGMCFLDWDHDGDLDLWHGQISYSAFGSDSTRYSHLYRQNDNEAFDDATWEMGMTIHGAWTGVRFDYDRDGDLDLLCASGTENVKLFRNDASRGNALTIRLTNTTTPTVARDAYGARVKVVAGGQRSYRWLPGTVSGGRASQMSSELHFGLGSASKIDSVFVVWSDGTSTFINNAVANSQIIIDKSGVVQSAPALLAVRLIAPSNHETEVFAIPTLRWHSLPSPAAGPTTAYVLQASYDSTFATTFASIPAMVPDTQYVLQGLTTGHTVYWRVRANAPDSRYSTTWNFTVGSPLPSTPTLVAPSQGAVAVRTKKAVFTWTRSTLVTYLKPTVMYDVQIATDSAFGSIVKEVTGTSDTSFTGADLTVLTKYFWRARARTAGATTVWSVIGTFTTYDRTGAVQLELPLDSAENQPVRPRFVWYNVLYEDAGFALEYDTLETFATTIPRSRNDTTTLSPTSLKPGRRYFWRVAAKNDEGQGEWSEVRTFTIDALSGAPFVPNEKVRAIDVSVNEATTSCEIVIELLQSASVHVSIVDLASRCVAEPLNGMLDAQRHVTAWSSDAVPSGLYIVVVDINGVQYSQPIVIRH